MISAVAVATGAALGMLTPEVGAAQAVHGTVVDGG